MPTGYTLQTLSKYVGFTAGKANSPNQSDLLRANKKKAQRLVEVEVFAVLRLLHNSASSDRSFLGGRACKLLSHL
jgi:hypothetical protein